MQVKFLDLYKNIEPIKKEIAYATHKVIENTSFIMGPKLNEFENNFAKFNNVKYCLGVGNGTDALEIAIKSLNLPKNSEIITQSGALGMKDMGKVMGIASSRLSGKADGKTISNIVRSKLS